MKGRGGSFPEVLNMSGGGSEDTNGSEPGIGFGFIGQFGNEWSVLVKSKSSVVSNYNSEHAEIFCKNLHAHCMLTVNKIILEHTL